MPKPRTPIINWNHPISQGLVAVFVCNERSGSLLNLVDKTTKLSLQGSGAWATNPGIIGAQLNCSQGNDSGAGNTSPPASMKPAKQVSFLWQGTIGPTAPTSNAGFMALNYNNDNNAPYTSYNLYTSNGTNILMNWNDDGTADFGSAGTPIAYDGSERQYVGSIKSGAQILYENGKQLTSVASTYTNINYGATPSFYIGLFLPALSRNSQSKCSLCYVWNRALSASEAKQLYTNPLLIFSRPTVSAMNTGIR